MTQRNHGKYGTRLPAGNQILRNLTMEQLLAAVGGMMAASAHKRPSR